MGIASALLIFFPTFLVSIVAELLYGLGYGCFTAVSMAIWTDVISSEPMNGNAKDMG